MSTSWFLVLTGILVGAEGQPTQYSCCLEKTVGTENYTFVSKGDVPAACSTGCVYYKNGSPESRFCFAPGNLPVVCVDQGMDTCFAEPIGDTCKVVWDKCNFGPPDPGFPPSCLCTCPIVDNQTEPNICYTESNPEGTECLVVINNCDIGIETNGTPVTTPPCQCECIPIPIVEEVENLCFAIKEDNTCVIESNICLLGFIADPGSPVTTPPCQCECIPITTVDAVVNTCSATTEDDTCVIESNNCQPSFIAEPGSPLTTPPCQCECIIPPQ